MGRARRQGHAGAVGRVRPERRHRGRRRNPDYNAGYRMGMEDAARYARGDYTAAGADGVVKAAELAEALSEDGQ